MSRSNRRLFVTICALAFLWLLPARPLRALGNVWVPMGPQPDCCFFPGGEAGRATTVAVNPMNENDLWLGTAGGGVWHSSDGGDAWYPMSDDQASLAIGSIALADCSFSGCTRIYVGTGENAIRRDTLHGAGLLKGVTNGILTQWTLVNGAPTFHFDPGNIYNVVLDPSTSGDSRVIYITLSSGVTASATESTVTAPAPYPGGYGIYKSTDDGAHWSLLSVPGAAGARPTDLEMANPNTLYAGFLGRGIFKWTTAGGWCPLNPGIPVPVGCPKIGGDLLPNASTDTFDHVEIDLFRGNPNILYATFGQCPDRLLADCQPAVYKSGDGGTTWSRKFEGTSDPTTNPLDIPCPGGYSRYTHALTIHPTSENVVFLGGFHLCKSTDNGVTWVKDDFNALEPKNEVHLDHHAVVFPQTATSRAYDVNDGGIAVCTSVGLTGTDLWKTIVGHSTDSNNLKIPLNTFEFQSIATSLYTARVIGGAQDNAAAMWIGANQWKHLSCCGDGGFSIMDMNQNDPSKPPPMYVTSNFGPTGGTLVLPSRSRDGGGTFPDPTKLSTIPAYDAGLQNDDPRSLYPPMIQDPNPPHPLYFGTNVLMKSTDSAASWTPVSPVLSSDPESEIVGGVDSLTAIGVGPTNANRVYIGYYSGKIFVTDGTTPPCASASCWPNAWTAPSGAPITWIGVDPTNSFVAYATTSGFASGIHVYWTIDGGVTWNKTGSHPDLNGVPANVVVVDPSNHQYVWLGTDKGIYKSSNQGKIWYPFKAGLPNVPVYALTVDKKWDRVVAATHGRGAYIMSKPVLSEFQGKDSNSLQDLWLYGTGFPPNATCTLEIFRQDGSVCASGTMDVKEGTTFPAGTIKTDDFGYLYATNTVQYKNQHAIRACLHGTCLGGVPISACDQPTNRMTAVVAICGGWVAIDYVKGGAPFIDPPSSLLSLTAPLGGFLAPVPATKDAPGSQSGGEAPSPSSGTGMIDIIATLHSTDGTSRLLCDVSVSVASTDTASMVLERARDAINADASCQAAGVSAEVLPEAGEEVEDLFSHPGRLHLLAPSLTGGQLVPSVKAAPGQTTGACYKASELGNLFDNQQRIMKVHLTTPPSGAQGGTLTLTETSGLGECSISLNTFAGNSAEAIAAAMADAFQAPGIPGPFPGCHAEWNPRDVGHRGDSLLLSAATEIVVCSDDAGVGVTVAPAEICFTNADCDDGNPCTLDTCNTSTGQCQTAPQPDGLPCDDGNACTVGNTCQSGKCGAPILCSDGNACTLDTCDPATGMCQNPPKICDDANPCTLNSCSPASGQCLFAPQPGAPCTDSDPCTIGDVCVPDPDGITCLGSEKCADSDPCSADYCDSLTGACSNPSIQCEDGNPCTLDFCQDGSCAAAPQIGQPCDDGNRCTLGEVCVSAPGGPACQGAVLNCNDGNPCSADSCNEITGACDHPPFPLAEAQGLQFTNSTQLNWIPTPGALFWNVYRGTIPRNMLGSRVPPAPTYNQTCFESHDVFGDGPFNSTDNAVPPVGGFGFYYLTTPAMQCGEGPLGGDWNGTIRPNSVPCP